MLVQCVLILIFEEECPDSRGIMRLSQTAGIRVPPPSMRFAPLIPAARRADWYARRVGVAAAREINEIPAARRPTDESRLRGAGIRRSKRSASVSIVRNESQVSSKTRSVTVTMADAVLMAVVQRRGRRQRRRSASSEKRRLLRSADPTAFGRVARLPSSVRSRQGSKSCRHENREPL